MFRKPAQFIALTSFLFIAACSKAEPEAVSEQQPAAEPPIAADSMPDRAADARRIGA